MKNKHFLNTIQLKTFKSTTKINNKKAYPTRKEFTLYPSEVQGLKETVKTKMSEINEDEDE
jgi:hypothetical protein